MFHHFVSIEAALVVEVQVTEDHPQYTNWLPVLQFHHRFRPSDSTSSKLRNCIALRIVPQPLEVAVAQSDHCVVLIDQYVANGGSHVFRNVGLSSRLTFPLRGAASNRHYQSATEPPPGRVPLQRVC